MPLSIFEVVFPVFALILMGFVAGRRQFVSVKGVGDLVTFVFYFAVPALVFRSSVQSLKLENLQLSILLLYFGCNLVIFAAAIFLSKRAFKCSTEESSIFATGAVFSNAVLIGFPVVQARYGSEGVVALTTILSIHTLIFFTLPSVLIERARSENANSWNTFKLAAKSVVKNPVIMAIAAGIVWSGLSLPVPYVADKMLVLLSQAATPCALFAVGASVAQYKLKGELGSVWVMSAMKLLLAPAMVWTVGYHFTSLSPLWLAVATLTAAMPIGTNVFILSERYGIYGKAASSSILLSTFVSVFSLSLVLYLLPN